MANETDIRNKQIRERIPNWVFYVPFAYYFTVRLGTFPKLLSWLLIYIMPTAFYSALIFHCEWLTFAINYLLVLVATFSLYELGYITNDTLAIRREQQPAIRLYPENFEHFARYQGGIYLSHLACGLVPLFFVPSMASQVVILAILPVFAVYNLWRSKYNVWLYPCLVFSRYLPFMLLYEFDWAATLMLFVSFPLLNWLERFSMPRYRFPIMRILIPTEESKTAFRVWYYAIVLGVFTLSSWLLALGSSPFALSYWLLVPVAVLFVYRLVLMIWLRNHHPKNYLNG